MNAVHRRSSALVFPWVLLALAGSLWLRYWVGAGAWFSLDDYVFYTRAAASPLTWDFLSESYNGHFMPGSMIWVWLLAHHAPLSYSTMFTVSLAWQLVVDLAFLGLLRSWFGWRPGILLPFALFLFTTITLPSVVWWAAALNQLPEQLFLILALWSHTAYLRTGHRRWTVGTVAALVAGLAFSEKVALGVPLLLLVTWLIHHPGPLMPGLRQALRKHARLWLSLLFLAIAYSVVYAVYVPSLIREGADGASLVETLVVAFRRTVIPGAIGGPWHWAPWGVSDALADPSGAGQLIAAVIVVGWVIVTSVDSVVAMRMWTIVALGIVVNGVLVWATRVATVGVDPVAAEYRYFTDLAFIIALAFGASFLPLRAGLTPEAQEPGARWPAQLPGEDRVLAIARVGVALLVIGAFFSASGYRDRWEANPGREYFANARADIAAAGPDVVVYNGVVPDRVVWKLLWPANLPSNLLLPAGVKFRPLQTGEGTTALHDIGEDGHLRASTVSGIAFDTGSAGCLPVTDGGTAIPLASPAFSWAWVVSVDYLASRDATLTITAGDTAPIEIPVRAGSGTAYALVEGEVKAVSVGGSGICVRGGVLGLPQPSQW